MDNCLELKDFSLDKLVINQELRTIILKDISLFETPLEKAIYIYIKMCKILTYDEQYFSVSQNEEYEIVQKHMDILNIEKINPINNKVVCYEFTAIYAKLLDELGIKSKINYTKIGVYGKSHAFLTFQFDKFFIKVDAVTNIFYNDMMQAKLNQKLQGLICLNDDVKIKQEFSSLVTKIYQLVFKRDTKRISNNQVESIETYKEIMQEYKKGDVELDLYQRLDILIDKVNSSNLTGIDLLSYLLQLRRTLFTEDERDNNIKIIIIRNNESKDIRTSAIVVMNEDSLTNDFYDNEYYLYNIHKSLTLIDSITLKNKFLTKEWEYIDGMNLRIPCLILENIPDRKKQIK